MAKNVKDIYGVLNGKGKREITLQKICDIIEIPVPEELKDIKDVVQNNVATRMEYAKKGCFFFRITNIGSKKNPLSKWLPKVKKKECMAVFVDKAQYEAEGLQNSELPLIPVENIIDKTGKTTHGNASFSLIYFKRDSYSDFTFLPQVKIAARASTSSASR